MDTRRVTVANKCVYHLCLRVSRQFIVEVNHKTDTVISNQLKQPTAQVQSVGYDNSAVINEMRQSFDALRRDVSFTAQKVSSAQQASCPNVSCLSTTVFLIFAAVQIVVLVGYFIYRCVEMPGFEQWRIQGRPVGQAFI